MKGGGSAGRESRGRVLAQRLVAFVVLLGVALVALPAAAALLDGEGMENWIVPVHLLLMAAVGALVGHVLPGVAGAEATRGRARLVGAVAGVAAAATVILLFFLLLSGMSGA